MKKHITMMHTLITHILYKYYDKEYIFILPIYSSIDEIPKGKYYHGYDKNKCSTIIELRKNKIGCILYKFKFPLCFIEEKVMRVNDLGEILYGIKHDKETWEIVGHIT